MASRHCPSIEAISDLMHLGYGSHTLTNILLCHTAYGQTVCAYANFCACVSALDAENIDFCVIKHHYVCEKYTLCTCAAQCHFTDYYFPDNCNDIRLTCRLNCPQTAAGWCGPYIALPYIAYFRQSLCLCLFSLFVCIIALMFSKC